MKKEFRPHPNDRHNLLCYLSSMLITFFGFYGFTYLVTWLTIEKTGDPQLLGNVMAMTMLPAIGLNLVAGRVLKYYSAKQMMFITDILTGILFIGTYYALNTVSWQITCLVIVAVLNKSIGVFYKLSNKTILPDLFAPVNIQIVNGYQTQIRQLAIVSATMLVTMALLWVTPATLILIMGIAFLVSAGLDWQFRTRSNLSSDSVVTVKLDRHRSWPTWSLLYAVLGYLVDATIAVAVPWLVVSKLHSHWPLSWFLTANATGILLAPLLLKRWSKQSLLTLTAFTGGCLLLMWPTFASLMITMFLIGALRGQTNISFFTTIQQIPTNNRNILMTGVLTVIDTTTVIGSLLAPRLILMLGSWTLPLLGGGILLFCLTRLIILLNNQKQSSSDIDENC
ncbi:MFS transporter [Lactiplantibacillus plantarum]|uniref:MFS transporter n=1 Tax=Lactiplantibacillus plantarum TaxID=1590 RepID=UPI0021A74DB6|nr:MFS transporter [Lactiplantibacillus plantarum]MCT3214791.1 MFS transporter [Lactiplantibacillus plantarum]MCT3271404.1 MFS transporter [Lactiplantibacillus plantarum]